METNINTNEESDKPTDLVETQSRFAQWKEAVFLSALGGFSVLFGFGAAVARSKKKDPLYFDKGMTPSLKYEMGSSLALRALGWGTFYAVSGCGLLFYAIWKILGVNDLQEFRTKAGNMLPRIPKNDPPQGRTEFKNLTDLLQYLIDEDERIKADKKAALSQIELNNSNDSNTSDGKP